MSSRNLIVFVFSFFLPFNTGAQDTLRFSGQFSSWLNAGTGSDLPLHGGARYIPQLNFEMPVSENRLFYAETSANIFGNTDFRPFDTISASGKIKPYRIWMRYTTDQFELRLGLQKLNFGSAYMLRPLMWFDQTDPRDPLQLTDGVWGLLARYYFLNNANLWLWGLYGNNEKRGWESIPVNRKIPEFGGRVQVPVPGGEAGFTYHHRVADSRETRGTVPSFDKIPENKFGLDAKWDLKTGLWIEGSYTKKEKDVGMLTNQLVMNAGIDYTFRAGNGLYLAFENLLATYDEKPFAFSNRLFFSMMSANYPVGLLDKFGAILYYNWTGKDFYSFMTWQRQFDKIMLYLIAFLNPDQYQLPAQTDSRNMFSGKGIQVMFVFNH